tara:strand:+ start:162 stop:374 length:213 start_codon:yes stop_codon:yes gene_type:complete
MTIRRIIIDKSTRRVLRHGFCDFENDGSFDPAAEEVVSLDFVFDPPCEDPYNDTTTAWYWDGSTFTTTAP